MKKKNYKYKQSSVTNLSYRCGIQLGKEGLDFCSLEFEIRAIRWIITSVAQLETDLLDRSLI